jgi:hypothetical protein
MTLSDTQRQILAAAAEHEAHLATAPRSLPAAARNAMFRSVLKHGVLTEVPVQPEYVGLGWRQDEAGAWIVLRITDDGLRAIGVDLSVAEVEPSAETMPVMPRSESPAAAASSPVANGGEVVEAAGALPTAQHGALGRPGLRVAAQALLAAWDANDGLGLAAAMDALRAAVPSPRRPAQARTTGPRQGTKQQAVLALLRRPDGATVAQIAEFTGWANHTVRGFFAGLKKRQGIAVEVLERVRQVGPNKQGAKGSYSIYRIAEAG